MPNVLVSIALGATARADGATRIVEFPFMTNHVAVEAGVELLMEMPEERVAIAQSKKQSRQLPLWKIDIKHAEKNMKEHKKGNKRKAEKT